MTSNTTAVLSYLGQNKKMSQHGRTSNRSSCLNREMCRKSAELEFEGRRLASQGETIDAMQKFVAVAQICGPCMETSECGGCRLGALRQI